MLAALGQSALMQVYDQFFSARGVLVAQTLLTRMDLADRQGYINARNTLVGLLAHGVIPIVNENDVVAVEEIKFGDNDTLSAMVANLVDADLLLILTDIDGLYTADPRIDPSAQLIPVVKVIDEKIEAIAGASRAAYGTGGMATKVEAARLATSFGCRVIVADGSAEGIISRIINGERLGTSFLPSASRLESRKRWIVSGVVSSGHLVVDTGAQDALRHRGRSLLPAGVVEVEGTFSRGDAVNVLTKRAEKIACGLVNYGSEDVAQIMGHHSSDIESILGYQYGSEVIHRDNLVVFERGGT